ncbi:2Fe-2S iron-sulfur cluster-binding protein [Vaginella massiliensis]|uniref:2Fe-2S iron-sulfur cluster-binding protein n=1 Tax=Vaginella massiliensis TaxID=1816680 RepID=UPI000838EC8F|nr:2Fe-2S iron-sulfur cluster-binding protein [Vaginella massiliensis]
MKFHTLKIKNKNQLTTDSVELIFDIPEVLHTDFDYKPGQYVTLDFDGVRRDYSLCNSPLNKEWSVAVKTTPNGKISNYIVHELQAGDEVLVSTPHGRFGIPSRPNEKRTLLAFAAGSGITPIMSMLEYTLQTEVWVNFYLFYGNKSASNTMFREKLNHLKLNYPNNLHVFNFYTNDPQEDWIFNGRIDKAKFDLILNQLVDINEVDEAMICGPEEMIFELAAAINEAGIIQKHIHFELFNPKIDPTKVFPKDEGGIDEVEVTVVLDGETNTVTWNREKNLIDTLLDADIDAPYSCKGGICSSCLCKIEEGEVEIGENFILTDADYAAGLTLACISRPKTPTLSINFDAV